VEKPSIKDPVRRYGSVDPDLFHAILNRCVGADEICMDKLMSMDVNVKPAIKSERKSCFYARSESAGRRRMLKCVRHHQLLLEIKMLDQIDLTKLLLGRLSWEAIPLHEPILIATFCGVALGGAALLGALTYFRLWGYLWREWDKYRSQEDRYHVHDPRSDHAVAWFC
jgi:hypothetical protein